MNKSKIKFAVGLLPALLFIFTSLLIFAEVTTVSAQAATTDTLTEGEIYAEANFWTATQSHRNGGEQVYGGRVSCGVGRNVEIGINASFSDPFDADFPPEIQPGVKWKLYENKKRGTAAAIGATVFVPLARLEETDAFVMIYGNASKTINRLGGARITIGGYALLARNRDFGSRQGWNFYYEQPVTRKVSVSAQWVTGDNRFGYLTPGVNIALSKKSSLFLGYSIGNNGYDNHGPYTSYGIYR